MRLMQTLASPAPRTCVRPRNGPSFLTKDSVPGARRGMRLPSHNATWKEVCAKEPSAEKPLQTEAGSHPPWPSVSRTPVPAPCAHNSECQLHRDGAHFLLLYKSLGSLIFTSMNICGHSSSPLGSWTLEAVTPLSHLASSGLYPYPSIRRRHLTAHETRLPSPLSKGRVLSPSSPPAA